MKIAVFDKKFEENKNFRIAVEALFAYRNVKRTKSMVEIDMSTPNDYSPLPNVVNKVKEEGFSLVYTLPSSFLSDKRAMSVRQELIKNDLLDIMITISLMVSIYLLQKREIFVLHWLTQTNTSSMFLVMKSSQSIVMMKIGCVIMLLANYESHTLNGNAINGKEDSFLTFAFTYRMI